ncbi:MULTISPECIES: methylmalonyl-CoA epimerase [Bacillus]|uniref:Methylmalonyl-CoA epimerase n=1 Tax=Bacillus xiamenensis TaxID=1178537 RepID=A0ABT4F3S7_9BACI|nr:MULTISPECIES: methylmalonyl-CoA epimerase [Bacillus]EKF35344.1 glyoxalase/bleomycin resistance protein/dioxygenase family protein [Bacillus xiamenensis]MBG9911458.1 glyoxalase [Bacillus xiamenensis]MCY9576712.1 methylmalonyl-CoA epimerase [Bacillus xiamenensis]QGX65533.1 methylmalonyl-CoA epimerase [Bacillus sp. ms-22]
MNQIDHIAIAVFSIKETSQTLYQLFNWQFSDIQEIPEQEIKASFVSLGDLHIELIEPMSDHSKLHIFLTKRGEGLHHIALKSGDIQADLRQLDQQGVQLLQKNAQMGANGKRIAFISPKETSGALVELCEPLKGERDGDA